MIRGEAFGTLKNSHIIFSLGKLLENMLYWECKAARSMESFLCDLGISQSQKCYPSFIPVTEENCISCSQDTRFQYDIYLSNALDGRCWIDHNMFWFTFLHVSIAWCLFKECFVLAVKFSSNLENGWCYFFKYIFLYYLLCGSIYKYTWLLEVVS